MFIKILSILIILSFFGYAEEIQIIADKDNTIFSESGSESNGAGGDIYVGRTNGGNLRRALIHFDIAGFLPVGSTIESVTLTLSMTKTRAGTETISIHTLNANWGEGTSESTGGGTAATPNDATWTQSFFDSLSWTTNGGDFISTADASTTVGGNGQYNWGFNAEMVADVQNWLDNPDNNFGWLIKGNEESDQTTKRFDSREGPTKPTLTVTYSSTTTAIVGSSVNQADKFSLSDNYPNPFNPITKIDINVPSANNQNIALEVFNITGQLVKKLHTGILPSGNYTFKWDGKNINGSKAASGVYFYSLYSQNFQIMKKMILLK